MLFGYRFLKIVRYLIVIMFASIIIEAVAEARAGRGRSMGRKPQNNSRPAAQQKTQPQQPQGNTPPAARPQSGSLMRGLAGGLAGGFLGSMLFSSLGHGMGAGGAEGASGGGGGGIGFLEIILIGGIAYLLFRWWKNRANQNAAMSGGNLAYQGASAGNMNYQLADASQPGERQSFLSPSTPFPGSSTAPIQALSYIDEDQATDIFFRIQGACTRRDLSAVRDLLSQEMAANLQQDFDDLISRKRSNRLENISVRRVAIGEPWQENGTSLVTVQFTASLLDYAVDDQSGQIVEGSDSEPVKFEENWVFSQEPGAFSWRLAGIQQL